MEYEVQLPTTPHVAGDYYLQVTCDNGQVLTGGPITMPVGLDSSSLPPMENVSAAFSNGDLIVSWQYPAGGTAAYTGDATDTTITIRVELFRPDGYRALRYHFRRFPVSLNKTSHTLYSWQSEIAQGFAFMRVRVRVEDISNASRSQSIFREYAIDGTTLTESEIKETKPKTVVIPLF
jgi:hypothetical protein